MPYKIVEKKGKFHVVNTQTGEDKGASDSREKAIAHLRILYAAEDEEGAKGEPGYKKLGWRLMGMPVGEGHPTPEQENYVSERLRKKFSEMVDAQQDALRQKAHEAGQPTITPRRMKKPRR